ncbi:3-octaprenyl-4-hydroxybenzoate carboxy-lyase, partial [Actinomyces sp. oral taxon 178 str. F0338]
SRRPPPPRGLRQNPSSGASASTRARPRPTSATRPWPDAGTTTRRASGGAEPHSPGGAPWEAGRATIGA